MGYISVNSLRLSPQFFRTLSILLEPVTAEVRVLNPFCFAGSANSLFFSQESNPLLALSTARSSRLIYQEHEGATFFVNTLFSVRLSNIVINSLSTNCGSDHFVENVETIYIN